MIIITMTGNRLALGPVLFTVDHIKSLIFSSLIPKQFIIIVSGGKYQLLFLGQNWQKLNVLDMSIEGRIAIRIQIDCL